jgi:hypothetical protein
MKKIVAAILLVTSFSACNIVKYAGRITISKENFKTEIPFTVEKNMAIVVPLRVGSGNEQYRFHFDTHAMEAAYGSLSHLAGNSHIRYQGSSSLNLNTTSGEKIDRAYYMADSIYLGNVLATNVSMMQLPETRQAQADTTYPYFDGILGVSIMRPGIWKIDFEHNILTFTSSMDSLANTANKTLFAQSDLFDIFKTEVTFDGLHTKMSVDLGANSSIMISEKEMKQLKHFSKSEVKESNIKTAAGISKRTFYKLTNEQAVVNNHPYNVSVTGHKDQSTPIIGLNFFRQFKYIIIDYPAGKLYVGEPLQPVTASLK